MRIFIDENLAPVLAMGFNILQEPENIKLELKDPIEVVSIRKVFGEGLEDEAWIPKVDKNRDCVITQDYNIKRIRHQRELCESYGLGMIYFKPPSKSGFRYWDMVKLLVKHWPEIVKKASKEKRPFSYKVTLKSSKLESL